MKSGKTVTALALIAFTVLSAGHSFAKSHARPYKAGELLVTYKTHPRVSDRSAVQGAARVRKARAIGSSRIHHIVLDSDTTVEQALAAYAKDPNVEIVEPNYILQAQAIPDDASFSQQWGLYNTGQMVGGHVGTPGVDMDAPSAWSITTGNPSVIVAVVDTGCQINHPDLAGNIWTNPGEIAGDGLDNDGNGFVDDVHGWDFSDGDNDPQDATGHGTHVAGIAAAAGDNNRGIAGVAWRAAIMPVRFMNAFDQGTTADAIAAIQYALKNGAKIINCSWGGAGYSATLRNVMTGADALFVCAAGNNATDTDAVPYYPASYSSANIISVAASDPMDQLAWFSNYGTVTVDVAAPGVSIYGLDDSRQTLWSDDFNDGVLDGWTTGGSGDAWDIEDPPSAPGAPALGSSPYGNYVNSADAWARLPAQDLSGFSASQLSFLIIGSCQTGADYLYLEVSTNGTNWTALPVKIGSSVRYSGITGSLPYRMKALADLGPWDGEPQVYLRLRFTSDGSVTGAGFFIDNMTLSAAGGADSYQLMQGTSMAAGYVSGLAALIQAENGSLTPVEVKSIIEKSVDLNGHVLDSVASGGRINAYNALTLLRELSLTASVQADDSIRLDWNASVPLTDRITIQRRMDGQVDFSNIGQVDADTTSYTDDHVSGDGIYYYRIQAETLLGDSGYSHQTYADAVNSSVGSTGSSAGGGGGGGCFVQTIFKH